MTTHPLPRGEPNNLASGYSTTDQRYVGWFHELDAWTEYWDIYHAETRGRYYFGDGQTEDGLLTRFLPRTQYPPAFVAWTSMALLSGSADDFVAEVRIPDVAAAVMELDALVARLFSKHFGDASETNVQADLNRPGISRHSGASRKTAFRILSGIACCCSRVDASGCRRTRCSRRHHGGPFRGLDTSCGECAHA